MFPGFPLPVKDQHLVTDIFKIAGTYYWVCPPGVYIVWLTGVASGGSSTAHASYTCSGGGGGEGVYMYPVIVIPGTVYTIVVGASVASGAGQNTSFGSLLTLLGGGAGQTQPYTYMPGSGGGMFGGVGVTTQVKGSSARNITSIHECGAAGGVSNGTGTMAGGDSSWYLGGTSGAGSNLGGGGGASLFGPGGNGPAGAGSNGSAPVSGYGGAGSGCAAAKTPGASAPGFLTVSYYR